ncbi:MAG: Sigma-54 DNA-binding domain protein [Thermotoga sp. 50_1627]|nr:MAG: Sigma-54 DNA-binding domain protein [Thermotoga sp. 50_64]KUK24143.1 MAG: Sigma-54 DNA-binding domain protein [Thermotoga sp. 50_1627]HBT39708.1 hypothetical protein [Pseudothermotoga sp.]HCO97100.1 hypothetical protein [Pseudothermotoga sp.]
MRLELDLSREFSNREIFFKFVEFPTRELLEFLKDSFPHVSLDVEDEETGLSGINRLRSVEKSLQEELMELIALLRLDEKEEHIAEYIIYNLDDSGKLLVEKSEICEKFSITQEKLEELIDAIKSVGPDGLFEGCVSGFGESASYVRPDVVIRDDLSVQVRDIVVYSGGFNKKMERIFLYLNELLKRRKEILFSLGNMIVRKNVNFLLGKSVYPNKIKLVDAADELELHVSTVSRAVSAKYVKTPVGTFPMRVFFGRNVELKFLLPLLCELLRNNPSATDEELRRLLRERGVELSRRTVNKYRNLIGGILHEERTVFER